MAQFLFVATITKALLQIRNAQDYMLTKCPRILETMLSCYHFNERDLMLYLLLYLYLLIGAGWIILVSKQAHSNYYDQKDTYS